MKSKNKFEIGKFLPLMLGFLGQIILLLTISLYFFNPGSFVEIYRFHPDFFDIWSDTTVLTGPIVASSLSPHISKMFILMTYLSVGLIYFGICLESFNSGIENEKNYPLTVGGYSSFLQDRIYSNHKFYSLSFFNIGLKENFELKKISIINLWDGLFLFLKDVGARYYAVYLFLGFVLLPWCAFNAASSTEISIVPFWVAVVVYVHIQLKCIAELIFFFRVYLVNKQ